MLLAVWGWEVSLQGGGPQCQLLGPFALPALERLGLSCEFPLIKRLMQMDTAQLQCVLGSERLGGWTTSTASRTGSKAPNCCLQSEQRCREMASPGGV